MLLRPRGAARGEVAQLLGQRRRGARAAPRARARRAGPGAPPRRTGRAARGPPPPPGAAPSPRRGPGARESSRSAPAGPWTSGRRRCRARAGPRPGRGRTASGWPHARSSGWRRRPHTGRPRWAAGRRGAGGPARSRPRPAARRPSGAGPSGCSGARRVRRRAWSASLRVRAAAPRTGHTADGTGYADGAVPGHGRQRRRGAVPDEHRDQTRTHMSNDQTTPQDPTEQHSKPAGEGQEISHPGLTSDMRQQPDHGEDSYRGSDRLSGKKAVITGGDSGIGRAVALAFAREGADVLISYLPEEEEDAQQTAALVRDAGRTVVTVPGDIREEQQCLDIIDRALEGPRRPRHPRQQRGLPDVAGRRHPRHQHRAARPRPQDQPLCDVLALQGRHPAHGAGLDHHQHGLGPGLRPLAAPARLRHHQGRHRQLHQGPGRPAGREGHPGQRRRARARCGPR